LGYDFNFARALLSAAMSLTRTMTKTSQRRLKALQDGLGSSADIEQQAGSLGELDSTTKTWPNDGCEAERRAILDLRRGQLLYSRKKYVEALACYDRAEQGLPDKGESLKKQLGEALYDLSSELIWPEGRRDAVFSSEAERILPKVVSWLPEKQGAWYRLGVALNLSRKSREAIPAYQRAIELDPKDAYPHDDLGNVYADLGRTEDAIAEYQRAIELDPKYASPHNGLGNMYTGLGRTADAIVAYQRAIELDPKDAYPHNGLGNVYRTLGRTDDAIAEYQRAIDLDPKYASPHYGLGNMYRTLGRTDEAIVAYRKAVELDPQRGTHRSSLAACLRKLGRDAEAVEQIAIARELISKENEYNRACFEAICGNVEEALALLKVALEKKQASLAWVRRDSDFESLRTDPHFTALVGTADEKPSADNSTG
jgi:tetratricopeptide (TPR) repeat protein